MNSFEDYKGKPGEANHRAIFTEENVRMIRSDPRTHAELARVMGVSQSTISNIRRRRTWKHVD